jgi:hypothetical protein
MPSVVVEGSTVKTLWRIVFKTVFGIAFLVAALGALALLLDGYLAGAAITALFALLFLFVAARGPLRRRRGKPRRSSFREYDLEEWEKADSREVKRPRDPRSKYCMQHIGQPITIKYKGQERIITPQRLFSKPKYK